MVNLLRLSVFAVDNNMYNWLVGALIGYGRNTVTINVFWAFFFFNQSDDCFGFKSSFNVTSSSFVSS